MSSLCGGKIEFRVEITCSGIVAAGLEEDEVSSSDGEDQELRFRYKWLTGRKAKKKKKKEGESSHFENVQTDPISKWERVYVLDTPQEGVEEEEEAKEPDGYRYEKTFVLSAAENTRDFARTFRENSRMFFFLSDKNTSYANSQPLVMDISGFLADKTKLTRVYRDTKRFSFVRIRIVSDRAMLSEKDRNALKPLSITIRHCHRLPGARLDMNDLSQAKYATSPNDRFSLLREYCSEAYVLFSLSLSLYFLTPHTHTHTHTFTTTTTTQIRIV